MCGIAGFLGEFNVEFLSSANDIMKHRGPDDSGVWFNKGLEIGLAHRRLSIIDLSSGAKQPMFNGNSSIVIVFNGEIYNFRELASTLKSKGYAFATHSDTEVLIHLYEEYGHEMLEKLNGIFAFAIWDNSKKELFVARDGLGVKPFYYSLNSKGFIFASELKALLKEPGVDRTINPDAVNFHLSYLWSPSPDTIVKSIRKLEPGFAFVLKDRKILKKWCFYDIPQTTDYLKGDVTDIARELAMKVKKCVNRQMISDVPIGAFLSGGLDSSSVVHFAKESAQNKLECFTIAFEDSKGSFDGFSEDFPYAKKVSEFLGVNLNTITVGKNMISRLEDMIFFLDEPQADPAPLNALFICEMARSHNIKVLLSGAGGDDVLSGYRRHSALRMEKYWSWLPVFGRRGLKYISSVFGKDNPLGRRLERAFRYSDKNEMERLAGYFIWLEENISKSLYTPDFLNNINQTVMNPLLNSLNRIPQKTDSMNKLLYLEMKHFLADHNLNYTDKMGMATGVEVRVPLLDIELIEFASKINPGLKQHGNIGKYIFKKAMEPYLPKDIIYRPKSGFGAPLRKWLHGDLKEVVRDLLSEKNIKKRGIFNIKTVNKMILDDLNGKIDAAYPIFALMCLEWWMRIFIDGNQTNISKSK